MKKLWNKIPNTQTRVSPGLCVLFFLISFTWALPQTLLGLLLFLLNLREKHSIHRSAVLTEWKKEYYGISLGLFIFTGHSAELGFRDHEYGHCVQSLLLGPFFLPVIGLPSILWCMLPVFRKLRRKKNISYFAFYTESWAERISAGVRDF